MLVQCTFYHTFQKHKREWLSFYKEHVMKQERPGNSNIKQQLRDIENNFFNSVEIRTMSAQEAVHLVLQLPMRTSSREVIFLPTACTSWGYSATFETSERNRRNGWWLRKVHSCGLLNRYMQKPGSLSWNCTVWYIGTDNLPVETIDDDENDDEPSVQRILCKLQIGQGKNSIQNQK